MTSICGIGKKTAAYFLAEIPDIDRYQNARQLAAHAEVTPSIFETGTSGKVRTPMTKAGNVFQRGMLFLPAMAVLQHKPGSASLLRPAWPDDSEKAIKVME